MALLKNLETIDKLSIAPNSFSLPSKRWHSAFTAIYCSRAFLPDFKRNATRKTPTEQKTKLSPSSSFTVINLKTDHPFSIDQTVLTELVKHKNLERLQNLGGVNEVVSALETSVDYGIRDDEKDIACRHDVFGSSTYHKPPSKSFFHFVVEAFKDLTIIILLVCAALFLGFGIKEHGLQEGWYDGGSIFVAVFIVIALSSVSNFRQNRQFDKLSQVSNNIQIEVMRSGRRRQISIFDIVVGDVICLKIGDQVPADGLFVDGHSLQVDESSMTGESDHVEVNTHHHPFLVSGTKVVDGYAKMLVTSVGMSTTWGQMMSSISRDTNEQTPLQERLNTLASSIGKVGLTVAFLVLVVLLIRYFTGNTHDDNGNREYQGSKTKFDDIFIAVVGIIVNGVTNVLIANPGALPLAVTLTLTYSMKEMMANHVMVRKLEAFGKMGSATTICTHKTGTLTLNMMKVTKFWLGQKPVQEVSPYVGRLIQEGVALNTTGSVYKAQSSSEFEFSGSPTEKAVLSWAVSELNMEMELLVQNSTILRVEAFNSKKKRSGVLIRRKADNTVHVHWKGAAEMVLRMCSRYCDASGMVKDLDDSKGLKFEQIIQGMAASSLRCIAFAHTEVAEGGYQDEDGNKKLREGDLTLLGIVGIKNPCYPGVKNAVETIQRAGVNIKMITGDNVFTATAIATECGILRPGQDLSEAVVEGEEFRNYTPEQRLKKVDKICVMARSSPFDKFQMVHCLKEKGHVVAVSGDDINGAPALKVADIKLSMGIRGTEVAKQSSDIVLLGDNFASVATVSRGGRCVYNNIQKFIQFQLTVTIAALTINFVAAVSAGKVPLTAVQLLWVNLIVETLGAFALATEKPSMELMDRPPVGRNEPLITNIMWRNLIAQALYQIAIILTLQFRGKSLFRVTSRVNDTLIFNTFVLCQVFNEFNARKIEKPCIFEGIHKNKLFLGIIGITIVLQVVMIEFLKKFADMERLNWMQWFICFDFALMSWPFGVIVKLAPFPEKPLLINSKIKSVMASFVNKIVAKKTPHVDINDGPDLDFSDINRTSITKLVKDKDRETLLQLGGVYGLLMTLQTDAREGINDTLEEIACRQNIFGYNRYLKLTNDSFFHFVFSALKDPIIIILLVCAPLSLGFQIHAELKHGWYNGGSIFIAVLVVVTFRSFCHYMPNRQFSKLCNLGKEVQVEVVRNGQQQQQVLISNIVVGDVVCLSSGSQVPADGLLLEGHSLKLDESSLTADHQLVEVNSELNPFLFSRTKVDSGYGKMLITSVGENTKWGEMISLLGHESLKRRSSESQLKSMTKYIGQVGSFMATITSFTLIVILLTQYFTGHMMNENGITRYKKGKTKTDHLWKDLVGIVVYTVAVTSSAIPEGLPLAVAITVAKTMKRMITNHALLRRLFACESLASATIICTEPFILTANELMVRACFGEDWMEEGSSHLIAGNVRLLLCQGIALSTSQTPLEPSSEFSIEQAILRWATKELGVDVKCLKEGFSILHAETLTEEGKLMKTLIRKEDDHTIHMHLKGKAEVVLAMCSDYYGTEGTMKCIDISTRSKLQEVIQVMTDGGFKFIAFSHKMLKQEAHFDDQYRQQLGNDSMALVCLMALKDPIGPGVRKAVEDCKQAGVAIKVITKEDVITAKAIASECGIIDPNEAMNNKQVVEALEFQNYPAAERMEKLDTICVIANASSADKLLVVKSLKQEGHVVAFTGNSIGDAEALKEADVGIHMGFQYNDTAVENSGVVILNGGLLSIIEVLHMGRGIYDNIKVFIQFLFAANIASLVTDFVFTVSSNKPPATINILASVSTHKVPYAVLQILWSKLIIGTLAAVALVVEPKIENFKQEQPIRQDEPLISNNMCKNIFIHASYEIIILLILQFKGKEICGVDGNVKDMMIYSLFVLFQVFAVMKARKPDGNIFKGRKLFWGIICAIMILQFVMVEFLNKFAGTDRLNWKQWAICIALAALSWPVGWLVKFIPVPEKPLCSYLKTKRN